MDIAEQTEQRIFVNRYETKYSNVICLLGIHKSREGGWVFRRKSSFEQDNILGIIIDNPCPYI